MAYTLSPLGGLLGLGIARFKDPPLEGSRAARVAIIPAIMGINVVSLLLAKKVADQEAESQTPSVPPTAKIEVEPNSHNYGKIAVGSSACKIFVVRNTGTANLNLTATTPEEPAAREFIIVSGGAPLSNSIAPGATHFVEVMFTPKGGAKTTTLEISSNDPVQRIVSITLSGTGETPNG